jgi:hypothetical protein
MGKKELSSLCFLVALLLFCSLALADPLDEISPAHQSYQSLLAIQKQMPLAFTGAAGLSGGATRLELGRQVWRAVQYVLGSGDDFAGIEPQTAAELSALLDEFAEEIELLGGRLAELQTSMAAVRQQLRVNKGAAYISWPSHWMYKEAVLSTSSTRVYDPKTGRPLLGGMVESEHPWESWRVYNELGTGGYVHWQFNARLNDLLSVQGKINTMAGNGKIQDVDTSTDFSGGSLKSERVSVNYQREQTVMRLGYFETNFSPFTMKKIWGRPTQLEGFYLQTALSAQMKLKALAAQKQDNAYVLGTQLYKRFSPIWEMNYNWVMDVSVDEATRKVEQSPFVASVDWRGSLGKNWRVNGEVAKSFAKPGVSDKTNALELGAARSWPKLNLTLNYKRVEKNFSAPNGYWGEDGYRPKTPDKFFTDLDEEYKFPNKHRLVVRSAIQLPRGYTASFKHRTMGELSENPLIDRSTYFGITTPQLWGQLVTTWGAWHQTSARPDRSTDNYKNTLDLRAEWAPNTRLRLDGVYLLGNSIDRLEPEKKDLTEIKYVKGTYNLTTLWQLAGRYKIEKYVTEFNRFVTVPRTEEWLDLALVYAFSRNSTFAVSQNIIRKTTSGVPEWVIDGFSMKVTVDL